MNGRWSNCLIEGVRAKIADPRNVRLIFFVCGWHFHVMWYDAKRKSVLHFTHRNVEGRHCDLLFKGRTETLTLENFNAYCERRGRRNLAITDGRIRA